MVESLASANAQIIHHNTSSMCDNMQFIPDLDHRLRHHCTQPQDLQLEPGETQDVLLPVTHAWWWIRDILMN